jgi:hypothetical protein
MKRSSVAATYELELIEQDLDPWLASIEASLGSGSYSPSSSAISELPKRLGLVRPLMYLVPTDRLVYAAATRACFSAIEDAISWSQGIVDFAHRLGSVEAGQEWIRSRYVGWDEFRAASLEALDTGVPYVVFTDLAAFYEHIDIALLISDLDALGAPKVATRQLRVCLEKWAQIGGRGLPQGHESSDILSKLYLNTIDRFFADRGMKHVRYSDDFRIFCHNRDDAQRALVDLARLGRRRGLTLQAAKSEILRAGSARDKIEGVIPLLQQLVARYISDVSSLLALEDPYATVAEIDAAVAAQSDESDIPIEVIRDAFQAYFLDEGGSDFDATLFHFLLNRLASAKDTFALSSIGRFLAEHPEETSYVLSHIYKVEGSMSADPQLASVLDSDQGRIYPHQAFQILRWAGGLDAVMPEVLAFARRIAVDPGGDRFVKGAARKLVGANGDPADMEFLLNDYERAGDGLEKAQIICSLQRMERSRRNAFLARAGPDDDLCARAVSFVKASNG